MASLVSVRTVATSVPLGMVTGEAGGAVSLNDTSVVAGFAGVSLRPSSSRNFV